MVERCGCFPHMPTSHAICTPPAMVTEIFEQASGGKDLMNAAELAAFFRNVQGEKNVSDGEAENLIAQIMLGSKSGSHSSRVQGFSRRSNSEQMNLPPRSDALDLKGFLKLLLTPGLNGPQSEASQMPNQDMTAPLSHYYVFASHNSYLTGNQLTSKSSTLPIVTALQSGCRVIELDCWERGGKIMVLHGNTLTKAIPFEDCVRAITENAFVASNYPVIVTIENHLSPALQKQAAAVLKSIMGDKLLIPMADERPPLAFQSPEQLKDRIIISDKPPSEPVEKQVAEDPSAVGEVFRNALERSSSSESKSPENEGLKREGSKGRIHRAQDRAVEKLANKAIAAHPNGIGYQEPVLKVEEFEDLLYIYCAKPSEMKDAHVKGGPLVAGERAIMANLSEPQLQDFINKHPNSLLEFSKTNLGRVYPFGLRIDSSNADPMIAWSHGFQVAAINVQGHDRAVWVAKALFGLNGGCGYVKKPDFLLPGSELDHEKIINLQPKLLLKVRVLLGTDWHRNYDIFKKPDYYVKVAIHGMHGDRIKKETKVKSRCREPHWEAEQFEFPIRVPQIAVLRLEVREHDQLQKDDMVGQACIPVTELKLGVRSVALQSRKGEPRTSKLLCHFELEALKGGLQSLNNVAQSARTKIP